MRILMFGRGVIASVTGWALAGAGHDVEFYVRPGRVASYGDELALDIVDTRRPRRDQRVRETWSPRYREDLPEAGDVDLIVVSLPHHSIPGAIEALSARLGDATFVMLSNMWDEPLDVIAPLPPEQVVWGIPPAGGGFDQAGRLQATLLSTVALGRLGARQTDRELAVREVFGRAGFGVREQPDIRGWYFVHTVTDASLYSQALQYGTMADLIGNTAALREAMLVGRELLPVVAARGVDLSRHRSSTSAFRLPSRLVAASFALANSKIPFVRRAFETHDDPAAEEPRAVYRDVLAEAQRLGVPTPRLAAAAEGFVRGPSA